MVCVCVFVLKFLVWLCYFICFFFFFKQKTAYEMRISDWSSDVCSSDLPKSRCPPQSPNNWEVRYPAICPADRRTSRQRCRYSASAKSGPTALSRPAVLPLVLSTATSVSSTSSEVTSSTSHAPCWPEKSRIEHSPSFTPAPRSEESRAGKERVSTLRSRWTPYNTNTTT